MYFEIKFNCTWTKTVLIRNQTVNQEDSVVQGSFDVGFKLISAANPLQVTDIVKLEASLNVNTADEDVMYTYVSNFISFTFDFKIYFLAGFLLGY